ncbi:MAG: hypothetical protein KIS76_14340 [Pyrinomonadaceae bacterium]|nr:hypothetical protein [Pyrinomonadaceae bacterium]
MSDKSSDSAYAEFRKVYNDVSATMLKDVYDEAKVIINRSSGYNHVDRVYNFKLIVENTDRAAFSEYYCVLREPRFGYLQRIAAVPNEAGDEDVNMPYLEFTGNGVLQVRLRSFNTPQRVLIIGQRISLNR